MLSLSVEAITRACCQIIDGKTCDNTLIVQEKTRGGCNIDEGAFKVFGRGSLGFVGSRKTSAVQLFTDGQKNYTHDTNCDIF